MAFMLGLVSECVCTILSEGPKSFALCCFFASYTAIFKLGNRHTMHLNWKVQLLMLLMNNTVLRHDQEATLGGKFKHLELPGWKEAAVKTCVHRREITTWRCMCLHK